MEKEMNGLVATVATNGSTPQTDHAPEQIEEAGALSSNMIRSAGEACALRAIEVANAMMERAKQAKADAEQYARTIRENSERMAKIVEDHAALDKQVAANMATTAALIAAGVSAPSQP